MLNAWMCLVCAGLLEIAWTLGLKYSNGMTLLWPSLGTVASIVLSFTMLSLSLRGVPFGTAYAVWTGIGAAGAVIAGMVLFGEPADPIRIACLALIIAGIVGLKLAVS